MNRIIIPIRGMHCQSCEMLVEDNLKDIPGITKVEVSQKRSRADRLSRACATVLCAGRPRDGNRLRRTDP